MVDRQKIVGWVLIAVSGAFIVYFLRIRLFGSGPAMGRNEWVQFIGSIVVLMIGTANVRLAAMRERKRRDMSR